MSIMKGAKGVIAFHRFSVSSALIELFPNIGLDKSKFQFKSMLKIWKFFICILFANITVVDYWNLPVNRRKYFIDFARENQFDPYNPKNWTTQRLEDIKLAKVFFIKLILLFYYFILGILQKNREHIKF